MGKPTSLSPLKPTLLSPFTPPCEPQLKAADTFNHSLHVKESLVQDEDSSSTSDDTAPKRMDRSIQPTSLSPLTLPSKHPKSLNSMTQSFIGGSMKSLARDFKKQPSFRGPFTRKSCRGTKKAKKAKKGTEKKQLSISVVNTKSISSKTFDDEIIYVDRSGEVSTIPTAVSIDAQTKESQSHIEPLTDLIIIIILLIDPISRRFQLLRLELDITKPTVAEILERIPYLPATEESLRTQTFDCMCDMEGLEYDHEKHISEYVDGSTLVIAVPKSNTKGTENVIRMAKSILHRRKVEAMLKAADTFRTSLHLKDNLKQEEDPSSTSEDTTPKRNDRYNKPIALSPLTPPCEPQLKTAGTFNSSSQLKENLYQEEDSSSTSKDTAPKRVDRCIKPTSLSPLTQPSKRPKSSNRVRHPIFAGVSPTYDGRISIFHKEEATQELNIEDIQEINPAVHRVCHDNPDKGFNQLLLCL